jgi:hypothetical protein
MDKRHGLVVNVVVGCGPTRGGYEDMDGDVDSRRSKGSERDDTCLFGSSSREYRKKQENERELGLIKCCYYNSSCHSSLLRLEYQISP